MLQDNPLQGLALQAGSSLKMSTGHFIHARPPSTFFWPTLWISWVDRGPELLQVSSSKSSDHTRPQPSSP